VPAVEGFAVEQELPTGLFFVAGEGVGWCVGEQGACGGNEKEPCKDGDGELRTVELLRK